MTQKKLKESFLRRYLEDKGVTEYEVLFEDEALFKDIIREFGEWNKFEKEVGILKRHIREREKFKLYWKMKLRKERFGEESLRHKNIEEELKKEIQEAFGSVKYLTEELVKKGEKESVIYDAHAYIISGGDPLNVKNEDIQLYAAILKESGSLEEFFDDYERSFIVNPYKNAKQVEQVEPSSRFDIKELLQMGYINEEQAEELREKRMEEDTRSKEA